jgi:hypothetical protein
MKPKEMERSKLLIHFHHLIHAGRLDYLYYLKKNKGNRYRSAGASVNA